MIKFYHTQFLFNQTSEQYDAFKTQIEIMKKNIKDDDDIKDINEMILIKENLKKTMESLTEKLQVLAEEEK